jgi:hypothetical protein
MLEKISQNLKKVETDVESWQPIENKLKGSGGGYFRNLSLNHQYLYYL